jgi:hypothetical protein
MNIDNFSKCNDAESVKHKQVACRDKSKFKCACGKVYDYEGNLRRHIRYKPISYTCPHCSKVISSRTGFQYHLDYRVCRRDISDDVKDGDDKNKHSSKSSLHGSSRKFQSQPPIVPSNARGIVVIFSL